MKIKTKLKINIYFRNAAIIFWLLETTFFIGRDGWHLKAVTEAEKNCDLIVALLLYGWIFSFISMMYDIVKLFVNANITTVSISKNETTTHQL